MKKEDLIQLKEKLQKMAKKSAMGLAIASSLTLSACNEKEPSSIKEEKKEESVTFHKEDLSVLVENDKEGNPTYNFIYPIEHQQFPVKEYSIVKVHYKYITHEDTIVNEQYIFDENQVGFPSIPMIGSGSATYDGNWLDEYFIPDATVPYVILNFDNFANSMHLKQQETYTLEEFKTMENSLNSSEDLYAERKQSNYAIDQLFVVESNGYYTIYSKSFGVGYIDCPNKKYPQQFKMYEYFYSLTNPQNGIKILCKDTHLADSLAIEKNQEGTLEAITSLNTEYASTEGTVYNDITSFLPEEFYQKKELSYLEIEELEANLNLSIIRNR